MLYLRSRINKRLQVIYVEIIIKKTLRFTLFRDVSSVLQVVAH